MLKRADARSSYIDGANGFGFERVADTLLAQGNYRLIIFIMSWFEIISVAILGGLFWLWFDSTRVHEIAVARARNQCDLMEVQLLDATVSLAKIKPARDENGHLTLQRTYTFEYSDTGNNRQPGSITMLGKVVHFLNI